MQTPEKIEFDEDIFLLITAFLKKSSSLTQIERQLFVSFPKVFEKNNFMFGNLFTTLN